MKNIFECDGSVPDGNYATPSNTIGMGNPTDTSGDMISLTNYIKNKKIVKKRKKLEY